MVSSIWRTSSFLLGSLCSYIFIKLILKHNQLSCLHSAAYSPRLLLSAQSFYLRILKHKKLFKFLDLKVHDLYSLFEFFNLPVLRHQLLLIHLNVKVQGSLVLMVLGALTARLVVVVVLQHRHVIANGWRRVLQVSGYLELNKTQDSLDDAYFTLDDRVNVIFGDLKAHLFEYSREVNVREWVGLTCH